MPNSDPLHLLHIYLDDHWAGAAAGSNLAKRMMRNNRNSSWADDLRWLSEQIEADDLVLAEVRRTVGAEGGRLKRGLAVASERFGRLKPNGRVVRYSPLSRLLEAEAMIAGVVAKRRLWAALRYGKPGADLAGFDFDTLEQRAGEQLELLRSFHREAAAMAFRDEVKGVV